MGGAHGQTKSPDIWMSGKLRPKTYDLRPKTRKTKTWKLRPGKLRPCFFVVFFSRGIIKSQLSLPLSGKMNEMNALTLTNNNLVVFSFFGMTNETISGCRRVAFSLLYRRF